MVQWGGRGDCHDEDSHDSGRVEPALKEEAETVFSQLGLSATQAIRLFYTQVTLQHGLPFEVKVPNAETREALRQAVEREDLAEHESLDALKAAYC